MAGNRKSIRLAGYDYTSDGAYFVTICTRDLCCLFDHRAAPEPPVLRDERAAHRDHRAVPEPPVLRDVVVDSWLWLAKRYCYVCIDDFVLMPNHLHGILIIENVCTGGSRAALSNTKSKSLGSLVGAFKTVSTKYINKTRGTPGAKVWQRNYYERVIRGKEELNRIREYISRNPMDWNEDRYNPLNTNFTDLTNKSIHI
jgi:REP element-mobilizing transposase RayT